MNHPQPPSLSSQSVARALAGRRRSAPPRRRATLALALLLLPPAGSAGTLRAIDEPAMAAAWRTLRTVDCARCHGRGHDGLAAPSILDYVRGQGRERFERVVLDGEVARGMPAYRENPLVARDVAGLYRFFAARAEGRIASTERPRNPHSEIRGTAGRSGPSPGRN